MDMHKIAKIALITNSILSLLFVYSSFWLWGLVRSNEHYLVTSSWGPFSVLVRWYGYNGSAVQTFDLYSNYPFWIFCALVIVNLFFILMISKELSRHSQTTVKKTE
jgi:Ni,Fe-hydrogenase I cytochrome b subunit